MTSHMWLEAFVEASMRLVISQEVRDWVGDELQNYAKVAHTTTRVLLPAPDQKVFATHTHRHRKSLKHVLLLEQSRCDTSSYSYKCWYCHLQIEELAVNIKEQSQLSDWHVSCGGGDFSVFSSGSLPGLHLLHLSLAFCLPCGIPT